MCVCALQNVHICRRIDFPDALYRRDEFTPRSAPQPNSSATDFCVRSRMRVEYVSSSCVVCRTHPSMLIKYYLNTQ